jgi:hypothetical protein
MARVNRAMNGKPIAQALAKLGGVQDHLDDVVFEMGVRAEELLAEHRQEGHAYIDIERGRIDRYVVLNDERGQKAAAAIEYGRRAYGITEDGEVVEDDDPRAVRVVGEMEGLMILHKATHLRGKKKGKVKFD